MTVIAPREYQHQRLQNNTCKIISNRVYLQPKNIANISQTCIAFKVDDVFLEIQSMIQISRWEAVRNETVWEDTLP